MMYSSDELCILLLDQLPSVSDAEAYRLRSLLRPSFGAKDAHFDSVSDLCAPKFATQQEIHVYQLRVSTIWMSTTVPTKPYGNDIASTFPLRVFPGASAEPEGEGHDGGSDTSDRTSKRCPTPKNRAGVAGGLLAGGSLMILSDFSIEHVYWKLGGIK